MGWEKICEVHDTGHVVVSLWKAGSGLSAGIGVSIGDGSILDLPTVEIRKFLMDGLIDDLWEKVEQLDGHDVMRILLQGIMTEPRNGITRVTESSSKDLNPQGKPEPI